MRLFPGVFLAADLAGRGVVPGWWIEGRWSDALLGGHPVRGLLKGVTALAAGGMPGGLPPGIRGLTARRQGGYRGSQRKEIGGHPVRGLLKGVTALAAGGMPGGLPPGIRGLTARRQGGYRGSQRKESGAAAQKETASSMPSLFYHPLYSTYSSRTAPESARTA